MVFSVTRRLPRQCSISELEAFEHLVTTSGEVNLFGLRGRIENAFSVVWISSDGGKLVGVGALKNSNKEYRLSVFRKAGSRGKANKYEGELGWVFIKEDFRGKGLSTLLMEELLLAASDKAIYATTRKNNEVIRAILLKFGFVQEGKSYQSDEGDYDLLLYIRKA